jgi:hypothetical protein
MRFQAPVELDRVYEPGALREERGEEALPWPDLEDDVLVTEVGQPADDAEDVVVDEEVLPELLARRR